MLFLLVGERMAVREMILAVVVQTTTIAIAVGVLLGKEGLPNSSYTRHSSLDRLTEVYKRILILNNSNNNTLP
jgi:hypothetical protein